MHFDWAIRIKKPAFKVKCIIKVITGTIRRRIIIPVDECLGKRRGERGL